MESVGSRRRQRGTRALKSRGLGRLQLGGGDRQCAPNRGRCERVRARRECGCFLRSADCVYISSFERRSQIEPHGQRTWRVHPDCSANTEPRPFRWFHAYATVDGYRSDQKSGQGSGSGKNIRFTKGRLDTGMLGYLERSASVCEASGGTELLVKE